MSSLVSDLAAVLQQVDRPGDFYATGTVDIHTPRLEVEGIGAIALPPVQAMQILDVAERAPYGRGSETLHDWRHPNGSRQNMGALTFFSDEVCPPGALDDAEDAEPDFEEATGNAGASFERFYQRAALVLWPRTNRAKVIAEGGLSVSIPLLTDLVERWEKSGREPDADIRHEALDLAAQIRKRWPSSKGEYRHASADGRGHTLLGMLERLGEQQWRLKAVETKRRHAADNISRYRCDLNTATDKRGRPYTLVCTKNQSSYERLAKQRRQDLEYRSRLGGRA